MLSQQVPAFPIDSQHGHRPAVGGTVAQAPRIRTADKRAARAAEVTIVDIMIKSFQMLINNKVTSKRRAEGEKV